jgi:CxxC motif-containing protein (DUF1111 family)
VSLILSASWVLAACAGSGVGSSDHQPDPGTAAAVEAIAVAAEGAVVSTAAVTEAPTSMDTTTNGVATQADMDAARDLFEEIEQISDGLGPVYNAQSCRECHQNPVTGAGS